MDTIATTKQAAELLHLHPRTVWRMCATGQFRHARKVGDRWLINLTREYPELFGQREGRDVLQRVTAK